MIALSPKQSEALDAIASEEYTFILFGGAMGGGKTVWGLSALLLMCQAFKGSRWCVVRENTEKLRTTTIPSFKKLNPSGKLREGPYEYTHPNGSQILFKGENYDNDKELNWLKGFECNGILFEEINECQEETLDIAWGRIGRWECEPRPRPIILATCNPNKNWIKKKVYDRWKDGTLPDKWLYIQSKVTDNPFLTQDYLDSLNNMTTFKYEVFVNGNWDIQLKTGGEFYKEFDVEKHVSRELIPYNPDLPLHISWDDNVNPYLPCGIFQIVGKEVRMINEICLESPRNKVSAVCAEIIRIYTGHKAGMFIYGDATAQKDDTKLEKGYNFYRLITDALRDFRPTLRVLKSNPSVVMRGNWINTVLEKQNPQNSGLSLTISPNCTNAINDFTNLKEAPDGTKFKEMETNSSTGVRFQKVGHLTDCFIGETLVITKDGQKRIDSITTDDYVLTRYGFRKVQAVFYKGYRQTKTYTFPNTKTTCTENHRFFTKEHGFKQVGHLTGWNTFCMFDFKTNQWKEKRLYTTGLIFSDTPTQKQELKGFIFLVVSRLKVKAQKLGFMFTGIFLRLAQYLKALMFTIKTETQSTTILQTLRFLQPNNTFPDTCNQNVGKNLQGKSSKCTQDRQQAYGISQKLEEKSIQNNLRLLLKATGRKWSVSNVAKGIMDLWVLVWIQNIVQDDASRDLEQELTESLANGTKQGYALSVEQDLNLISGENKKHAQCPALPVYDIQVEGNHEFFANGILVHNCTDYLLCSAFAHEFQDYQRGAGGTIAKVGRANSSHR